MVGAVGLMLACYTAIFMITSGSAFGDALQDAAINVGALSLWSAAAWWLCGRVLLSLPLGAQAVLHPLTGFGFAIAWYFTVTVLLGWRAGDFSGAFSVRPFSSIAFIWQAFQGLTVYGLIVALAVIQRMLRRASAQPDPSGASARLLVRSDDEFVSVAVDDIVCIERAGDYAQLTTSRGRHLTRKSLAELERQLPAQRFLRIHRSHLINLDALEAAEPIGGGRLRARLAGGIQIDTSRAGAKQLRERAG